MTHRERWLPGLTGVLLVTTSLAAQTPPIQDNSFLIEEAYNQERGVVQHISLFGRERTGNWSYGFTQEWPFRGQSLQLSYSIPVLHSDAASSTGLGDVLLNVRYQVLGRQGGRLWVAPRLSAVVPTGRWRQGRGDGVLGIQLALPASLELAPRLSAHANAGLTIHPSAHAPSGDRATRTAFNAGASLIWLAVPTFNVLLESVLLDDAEVTGPGRTARQATVTLSPGIRWAHNFRSGLQIVPGIAYSFVLGEPRDQSALVVYLSFEHPFRKQ